MKLFIRLITATLVTVLVSSCVEAGSSISIEDLSPQSSMAWGATKFLEDQRFHSVSIAIYDQGKTYTGHFGELTLGAGNTPNDLTLYELGSVSKLFNGTLTAKAVLEGRIKLDDEVTEYLANAAGNHQYKNLSYYDKPILVRHLLTHTSGFPNIIPGLDSKETYFRKLNQIEISSAPGNDYSYSNTAPELMAYILEVAYQRSYTELLEDLFLSLNMKNTSYRLDEKQKARLVQGYNGTGELMPNLHSSLWGGSVGLHSTSKDLIEFMRFQLEHPNKLSNENRRELFSVDDDYAVAYFWQLVKEQEAISYRHHGGIYGMQNWLMLYPEHDIGISVITNVSFNGVGGRLESLSNDLLSDLLRLRK